MSEVGSYHTTMMQALNHATQHLDCSKSCPVARKLNEDAVTLLNRANQIAQSDTFEAEREDLHQRVHAQQVDGFAVLCYYDACRAQHGWFQSQTEAEHARIYHERWHAGQGQQADVRLKSQRGIP